MATPVLRVGAAYPDPPFNGVGSGGGFDIDLMSEIAKLLGSTVSFVPFHGADFNDIFAGLDSGQYDCVAAGTTVTPQRETMARFCEPYLISGQSLAVDTRRHPRARSVEDLQGLTIGVQHGNTSGPIAEALVARGAAKQVRVYDYGSIQTALTDLTTGACDAFMKLAPVLTELVSSVAGVEVVQRGISSEKIAIAVPLGDDDRFARISAAQSALEASGKVGELRRKWLGSPRLDQSG
jgi:polar amino acid transport system substrate-binding protein